MNNVRCVKEEETEIEKKNKKKELFAINSIFRGETECEERKKVENKISLSVFMRVSMYVCEVNIH